MKSITLLQPWASLIAAGVKPYETRGWAPPQTLIGQRIAIHAGLMPARGGGLKLAERAGLADMPLGCVVCTAVLAAAYQCGKTSLDGDIDILATRVPESAVQALGTLKADEYGDYGYGRWAWHVIDIQRLITPLPWIGRLGIFEIPDEFIAKAMSGAQGGEDTPS